MAGPRLLTPVPELEFVNVGSGVGDEMDSLAIVAAQLRADALGQCRIRSEGE